MNAVNNFLEAFGIATESSSEHVLDAAEKTRDTKVVGAQLEREITASAQRVTSAANTVIVLCSEKEARVERLRGDRDTWAKMARENATEAATLPADNPRRGRLEALAKSNLLEKQRLEAVLEGEERTLAELLPRRDRAVETFVKAGFSKQTVLNTAEVLRVEDASEEMRKQLADAERQMTDNGTLQALEEELKRKIDRKAGEADAAERLTAALPPSEAAQRGESAMLHAQRGVDAEFEKLMAEVAPKSEDAEKPKAPAQASEAPAPAA